MLPNFFDNSKRTEIENQRLAESLLKFMVESDRVRRLSDRQLVEAVVEEVWGKLNLGSKGEIVLDELITRFQKMADIDYTETDD